jgi:hypothetical protein
VAEGSTWARAEAQAAIDRAKSAASERFMNTLSIKAFSIQIRNEHGVDADNSNRAWRAN